MDSEDDPKKKPFRFVKRKLSVHFSIINNLSPKGVNCQMTKVQVQENVKKQ